MSPTTRGELRWGKWTALAFVVFIVAIMFTMLADFSSSQIDIGKDSSRLDFVRVLGIGLIYGCVSQAVWIAMSFTRTTRRLVSVVAIVSVGAILLSGSHCIEMHTVSAVKVWAVLLQEWLHLSGLAIAQTVLFFVLGSVAWKRDSVTGTRPARQFSLGGMVFLTLAVAVLLAIGKRYPAPIDGMDYWAVWLGIWIVMPLIAATGMVASTNSRRWVRRFASGSTISAAPIASLSLVVMEKNSHSMLVPDAILHLQLLYGLLFLAFALCCLAIPFAGCADENLHRRSGSRPPDDAADATIVAIVPLE